MSYFNHDEIKAMQKVLALQTMIAEQAFYNKPSPLLEDQLLTALVFAGKFKSEIIQLQALLEQRKDT